ncbi:TIGR02680 family protein [Algiphilus sp. NNCM1]|uniref:TIGR02680 family protein n=1 Tax=Algiphilus sp. TaxID=1872431 RepID=UPI001CA6955D|nr:TIGR02680 family protein [Algiphilus sp.]MBY8965958.1 TIGR02680 family protein [Algiphilus acroporae]MCI5062393.1 TIGR02680 family protein [Algiphilus sp.]MCI5102319.1 TIGR02680 family protein [Algiphilus sp.]
MNGEQQTHQPLPEPARERWQPLRVGLVELYHYDSEEFWFHDGHLLLRGNNGTGKSKVLSLTLPFLLDAQLSAARVEPGGERNKRMEWNLLLGDKYERRIGYSWIELGRRDAEGRQHFLTLGCGLHAAAGRSRIDAWHFITEQRVGRDLHLFTPEGTVLSRDRLGDALHGHGQRFDTARDYRRAIDERLFRLGDERYGALMDTLIQLRQPQLSKNPDERVLSQALTHSLAPLPQTLLQEVAEAMAQLESYRDELQELESLRDAVADFGQRYRHYAAIQSRRRARALRQAQTELDNAARAYASAEQERDAAQQEAAAQAERLRRLGEQLQQDRAAHEELATDPLMQDARRLEDLQCQAKVGAQAASNAEARWTTSQRALEHEQAQTSARDAEAERRQVTLEQTLDSAAQSAEQAGMRSRHDAAIANCWNAQQMLALDASGRQALQERFDTAAATRHEQLAQLRKRLRELEVATAERERVRTQCAAAAESADRADSDAREAAAALEAAVEKHVAQWQLYLQTLTEIQPSAEEADTTALLEWAESQHGAHPLRACLQAAAQRASEALAAAQANAASERDALNAERATLASEREALQAGRHAHPAPPPTRDPDTRSHRAGGPLWQLVEFREAVPDDERAGLEAALEAANLLDAWVSPSGALLDPHTFDIWLQPRGDVRHSLGDWLQPAPEAVVDNASVAALLASIDCAVVDDGAAEAWVAPDGRFRVGPAQGAWHKEAADYIGFAAREAARQRRLQAIDEALATLEATLSECSERLEALRHRRTQLSAEWNAMPDSEALAQAHATASAAERTRRAAQEALRQAEALQQQAENAWQRARDAVTLDAEDLQLPATMEALADIESALQEYRRRTQALLYALDDARRAQQEADTQRQRLDEAQRQSAQLEDEHATAQRSAREAEARFEALREQVGEDVDGLQQRLGRIKAAIDRHETALQAAQERYNQAQRREAAEAQKVTDRHERREAAASERQRQVETLEAFAGTGLLAVALPDLELPQRWTIDPVLTIARRAEQALETIDMGDDAWNRAQTAVSRDYNELQRALSAQGHRAEGETTDFGFLVSILYGGRAERPDRLERKLDEEIGSRREVLTAREREVLESHLEHEVAQHLQWRLRETEALVARMNQELEARPTSTGVRFKLEWEARPERDEDAPPGLAAVRDRLVRRSADAWSAEDRRAVGAFLTGCIQAERNRDSGSSLQEHLAHALDYRRWHRFRVRRFAGGNWGALSGPASSGERALGLTVPLFAAASAHYASCDSANAPRLVMLDEAFAGIDDEARAHCMALIREFDLDFVMTSEREWGCYRELPGVSICHLVRRENVDAVFVSRWHWDGAQRRRDANPPRELPAAQ